MDIPTVAVVVPTAGRREDSLRRLIRLCLEDPATAELAVVLDQPGPGLRDVIRAAASGDARVDLLEVESPPTPERDRGQIGRDFAIRHVKAEVVLCLDDDLEPMPGLVSAHAKRHAERPGRVIVGYSPVGEDSFPDGSAAAIRHYSESYERACAEFRAGSADVLLGLWGGHFSVRRDDWLRSEREAEAAQAGRDDWAARHIDTSLGYRFRAAGLLGTFHPELVAVHRHRRTIGGVSREAESLAYGRVCLHLAYPDLTPSPERWLASRTGGRLALILARDRALNGAAIAALLATTRAAARLHLRSLEFAGVRALSLLGFARGIREAREDLD